jgi:DNA-binding response OmpR family regulator
VKILLVEDERGLSEAVAALLKKERYETDAVYDGIAGEDYAMSGIYDLVILDVALPKKNGLDVLRALRKQGNPVPTLLLTAKSEVEDKIDGLDAGADDYLTKPFASGELMARIRAATRRKGEYVGDAISAAGSVLDKNRRELICGKNKTRLASKEYQILESLMTNFGQIIPKERLIEKIWGFDSAAEYNAIEVYVSFARKKLAALGSKLRIKTVRNAGYAMESDDND